MNTSPPPNSASPQTSTPNELSQIPSPTTSPKSILILSNDLTTPFAKTSDFLSSATSRLGIPSYVRDTSDARLFQLLFEGRKKDEIFPSPSFSKDTKKIFEQFIHDAEIEAVLSLDLNWLLIPNLFQNHPQIQSITSLWFDDFRSWCTGQFNIILQSEGFSFQKCIKNPKVKHCFYGQSQAQEAQLLGVTNQRISPLAAPYEYLKSNFPCEIKNRFAFIGNPGFRGTPHPEIVAAMHKGADLVELRKLCQSLLLLFPEEKMQKWIKKEPTVLEFINIASEAKIQSPYQPALQILQVAGEHYPRAFHFLNEIGAILDVAFFIKLINRYDRPAFIHRLYQKGWIDVYSNETEWSPYDIQAKPYVSFNQLPRHYQKYAFHLNAPNSVRDATANEKLFEIAACGRLSLNLESPDVKACYSNREIVTVTSLKELETAAFEIMQHPDQALEMGKRARVRTGKEHLWDHRIKSLFHL